MRHKQKQDINQDIDVLNLSPTESKHSVIEIEMQNIRSCLVIYEFKPTNVFDLLPSLIVVNAKKIILRKKKNITAEFSEVSGVLLV